MTASSESGETEQPLSASDDHITPPVYSSRRERRLAERAGVRAPAGLSVPAAASPIERMPAAASETAVTVPPAEAAPAAVSRRDAVAAERAAVVPVTTAVVPVVAFPVERTAAPAYLAPAADAAPVYLVASTSVSAASAAPVVRASAPSVAPAAPAAEKALPSGSPKTVPDHKRKAGWLNIAIVVAVVPGLFATFALPAYAFAPDGESGFTTSALDGFKDSSAQSVTVAASADAVITRESYTATSQEELDAAKVEAAEEAARQSRIASYVAGAVTGVRAEGDDYPWAFELPDSAGGGLSPLGYYFRECVDFVAWRLNRDAGSLTPPYKFVWSNLTPSGGSAYNWANAWQQAGRMTGSTPVPGSVAWFNGNHVAYVQKVSEDGQQVTLEEYNWGNDHAYHTRTVEASSVPLYLYAP
ncbi:CHAP domain-containing protein [Compostimonas suwonensis]|uniref:CHAP domain-containing protein n=1 Tax=Compostimonas suwonensis TaxID=1048394 RepID=A0A2M9BVL4_9MICO|nr:CHAP domain-containing protein [Compostimonas suwonensis]PJJ61986.1 CHAP domain-containing protein [Compostimonas suwonensis]